MSLPISGSTCQSNRGAQNWTISNTNGFNQMVKQHSKDVVCFVIAFAIQILIKPSERCAGCDVNAENRKLLTRLAF